MIKNILFDLGGVIIKQPHGKDAEFISNRIGISIKKASELMEKCSTPLLLGEIGTRECLEEILKDLELNYDIEELYMDWQEHYEKETKDIDTELLKLVRQLKKNYAVYIMTDTIDLHDKVNRIRGVYENFDSVFKSFEEGYRKPDEMAYRNVLKKIDARPDECVFIDDTKENVLGARDIGMSTIHYQDQEDLEKEFSKLGIM